VLESRGFALGGDGVRALLAVLLAAPSLVSAGDVVGQVELIEKGGRKAPDLSDVIVFLDGVKARPSPAKASIVMRAKAFTPRVVAIPVGGTVEFPNDDPIFHNAFSVSGENRFDLDLYKRPKIGAWTFKSPGIVRVYCNIHPQMSAVVLVRDNPFFVKATREGAFSIEGVPAGRYTLKAWHERAPIEPSAEVAVPAEGRVTAQLTLDGSGFKRFQHKNKFGKDYASGEKY
jgi:plastocyanin